jgi:hypothetical protein
MSETSADFVQRLFRFLTSQLRDGEKVDIMLFVAGCAALAILVLVLDLCLFALRRTSLFDFKYTLRSTAPIVVGWTVGAAIAGYLGQIFSILQVTLLACATAGLGWPALAAKLLKETEKKSSPPDTGS